MTLIYLFLLFGGGVIGSLVTLWWIRNVKPKGDSNANPRRTTPSTPLNERRRRTE